MKALYVMMIALVLCSCDERFTKEGWMERDERQTYPRRDRMVYDLVHNYKLKNLPAHDLKELLGEPDETVPGDTPEFHYPLELEYEQEKPVAKKTLVIRLNPDSTVNSFRIDKKE